MKKYGFLSIALVAAVTIGCNGTTARTSMRTTRPVQPSTAGTEGRNAVSGGDKDFVKDVSAATWPRSNWEGWRPIAPPALR